jgi:hypothetical protein
MSAIPQTPAGFEGIMRALDRQAEQDREHAAREAEYAEARRISQEQRSEFLTHCRPATLIEYTAWMIGWLRNDNEPSSVYDYPFTRRGVQVVGNGDPMRGPLEVQEAPTSWWALGERPESVPSLYGSASLHVIVPNGVDFTPRDVPGTFHGQCGHSTFYFMDRFQIVGDFTPVYSDMLPVLASAL